MARPAAAAAHEFLYGVASVTAALAAGRRTATELFISGPEALERPDVKRLCVAGLPGPTRRRPVA